MANNTGFLGRGWSFPAVFVKSEKEVKMLEGENDVQSSIEIILSTEMGERVLIPGFGWKRNLWLFESLSTTTATAMAKEIETALLIYEPRIELNEVRLLPAEKLEGRVEILIDYTVKAHTSITSYPFYLTENK
jgi:phage baseplate assembly protein W